MLAPSRSRTPRYSYSPSDLTDQPPAMFTGTAEDDRSSLGESHRAVESTYPWPSESGAEAGANPDKGKH